MHHSNSLKKHTGTLPDGTQITYYEGGAEPGMPVVLLHGGGTDHAMLSWRDTIPALLEAGYRIYAPDYPGYGESPPASQLATLDNLLGWIEALMDIWGLDSAALTGVSMGGALAIGYTLAHQQRVRCMVLVGSYGIQDRAPSHRLSYFLVRMPWLMDAMWGLARGSRWAASYSLKSILRNPQSRTEALVDEVFAAMQIPSSQRAFGQFQRDEILWDGMKTNYMQRLPEIQVPVLLVHGSNDIGVPLKYARQAAARFPNARLEVIQDAGHWTQRDFPQQFNRLVLEFLNPEPEI